MEGDTVATLNGCSWFPGKLASNIIVNLSESFSFTYVRFNMELEEESMNVCRLLSGTLSSNSPKDVEESPRVSEFQNMSRMSEESSYINTLKFACTSAVG